MTPESYQKAKLRVKAKALFWKHLRVFAYTELILLLIANLSFFFPVGLFITFSMGWLVLLFFHFKTVYPEMNFAFWRHDWEEQELRKEVNRVVAEDALELPSKTEMEEMEMRDALKLKDLKYRYDEGDSEFV